MKKTITALLFGIIVGGIIGWLTNEGHRGREDTNERYITEVYRDTVVDTILYLKPMQSTKRLLGYKTYNIDIADVLSFPPGGIVRMHDSKHKRASGENAEVAASDTTDRERSDEPRQIDEADSAAVRLPIVQRQYADSTYEAYVSGPIDPRLDSIVIYPRTITIREREKKPPDRWGIGIVAGYGYTRQGLSPYIGVGITYSIITF